MHFALLLPLLLAPKIQVTTAAETRQMRAEIQAIAEAHRAKRCPRPTLWGGEAIPGDSGVAVLSLLEGPEAALCLRDAKALQREPAPEEAAAQAEILAKVEQSCVRLPRLIHEAARYAEGCSPFLIGRRKTGELRTILSLSKAAAVVARGMAEAGRPADGARLLLDTARINQDLMRGGASMLLGMISVTSDELLLEALEPMLPRLDPDALIPAIDGLLAQDPHFSELLQADGPSVFYYDILPSMDAGEETTGLTFGASIPDDMTLVWIAMKEMSADYAAACDPQKSLEACGAGLKALEAQLSDVGEMDWKAWLKLAAGGREAVKRQVIDILKGISTPAWSKYVERFGQREARWRAARAKLAARKVSAVKAPTSAPASLPASAPTH